MLDRAAVAQLLVHRRGEEANRPAPFVLGAIEGRIGISKQRTGVAAVPWMDRDPDAEVEFETVPVDLDVAAERATQPVREQFSARRQRALLGDHDEFVTPDAREKGALRRDL